MTCLHAPDEFTVWSLDLLIAGPDGLMVEACTISSLAETDGVELDIALLTAHGPFVHY